MAGADEAEQVGAAAASVRAVDLGRRVAEEKPIVPGHKDARANSEAPTGLEHASDREKPEPGPEEVGAGRGGEEGAGGPEGLERLVHVHDLRQDQVQPQGLPQQQTGAHAQEDRLQGRTAQAGLRLLGQAQRRRWTRPAQKLLRGPPLHRPLPAQAQEP